jgi:hypothetical protein
MRRSLIAVGIVVGVVALVPVLATAALVAGLAALAFVDLGHTPRRYPAISDVGEHGGQLSFRQPDGTHTILDLATGHVVGSGGPPPIGWRRPDSCSISDSTAETCTLPNGALRFGDGRLTSRTPGREWNAFHFSMHNTDPDRIYAVGDRLLIASTGWLSTVECVDARSGRSLWIYIYAARYHAPNPYNRLVVGGARPDPFAAARNAATTHLGVNVTDDPGYSEPYAGTVVFDPQAEKAAAKARTARRAGWVSLAIVVVIAAGAVWRDLPWLTIVCLAALGILLLSFGYVDPPLSWFLSFAIVATATVAWIQSRRGGHWVVAMVVVATAGLWILPSAIVLFFRF